MSENSFVPNEPFDIYISSPGLSASAISSLLNSPHAYEYFKSHPRPEPTKSMELGKMLHLFLLEPDSFRAQYAVTPEQKDFPGALVTQKDLQEKCKAYGLKVSGTKAELTARLKEHTTGLLFWDDIVAEATGGNRKALGKGELDMLLGLEKAITKHTTAKKILVQGVPEVSGYWSDSEFGIKGKMRADWLTENGYIVDLKTTTNGKKMQWQKKLFEYRYDVQAAWYLRGFKEIKGHDAKGFIHLVVETQPPYHVFVYVADATVIECGETGGSVSQGYRQAIDILKECDKNNFYPMPQMEIESEAMPDWTL